MGKGWEVNDGCMDYRLLEPTISLDVTILKSIRGTLEVGEEMTIHFGGNQITDWSPYIMRPYWNGLDLEEAYENDPDMDVDEIDLDEVEWQLDDGYFSSGTQVGLGLFYHEEQEVWSPTRRHLFYFDDDELQFQDNAYSCSSAPWEGDSLQEFTDGVTACTQSPEALTHNEQIKE